MPDTFIVSLDVGSSSVRTLAFDRLGREIEGFGLQWKYDKVETQDGGIEIDADALASLSMDCLHAIHTQIRAAGRAVDAVSFSAFWHCFLGVDAQGAATTPIIHLFDTRSAPQVATLKSTLDETATQQRVGCVFHTSYWPAKLLWLAENRADDVQRTAKWLSFGEYLFLKLFGEARTSTSMASASGLWNQNEAAYDARLLSALPLSVSQLTPLDQFDEPATKLTLEFAGRWPALNNVPWFPSIGDGACNNIGAGGVSKEQFALMVGTSGAMRVVVEAPSMTIPNGLWCYRVDPRRFVLGGALSNGGDVFKWMQRTLQLPPEDELERTLAASSPGTHGLGILPFFAGERSPYWRPDFRAAFTGMTYATTPVDILRASLESVAVRFSQIYQLLEAGVGRPQTVIASGGALASSPAWAQMMTDALGRPIVAGPDEASARGAALLALERIGAIASLTEAPPDFAITYQPDAARHAAYRDLLTRQQQLIEKLF